MGVGVRSEFPEDSPNLDPFLFMEGKEIKGGRRIGLFY